VDPPSISKHIKKIIFGLKTAGGYPPSILKISCYGIKMLVETHQAF
jgi:hypothetical protein